MIRTNSISKALSLRIIFSTLAVWMSVVGLTYLTVSQALEHYFDASLEETAQRILPLALDDFYSRQISLGGNSNSSIRPQFSTRLFNSDFESPTHKEDIAYRLIDVENKKTVIHSHDIGRFEALSNYAPGYFNSGELRGLNQITKDGRFILQIFERRAIRFEAIKNVLLSFFIPILVALPALVIMVVLSVKSGLKPLQRLSNELNNQDPRDLKQLIHHALPAELEPIYSRLNSLLKQIDKLIERERQFASNTAHELRTPLALMKGEITRLKAQSYNHQIEQDLAHIQNEVDRLALVTEKLLQLARSDSRSNQVFEEMDLSLVLDLTLRDLSMTISPNVIEVDKNIKLFTDIDAFGILIKNIIENAFKYSSAPDSVTLRLEGGTLYVRNKTNLSDDLSTDSLFERGNRQRQNSVLGSGLGLSIVRTISDNLGIEVDIEIKKQEGDNWFVVSLDLNNHLRI